MQTSLTSATANVVRIDPCGWEADPYFIMEQGSNGTQPSVKPSAGAGESKLDITTRNEH
jgi:hypothetical protein